eukprot:m.786048 g.786048  ORF g.786048 m.786048 type:complete len:538 (+) comp23304_c0_seq35:132-1745(+)
MTCFSACYRGKRYKYHVDLTCLFVAIQIICVTHGALNNNMFCWHDDVFGETSFRLTQSMCARSIKNFGDPSMITRVAKRIDDNLCLKIVAIGGSVTEGIFVQNDASESYRDPQTYVRWLKRLLDTSLPCGDGDGHDVITLAASGKPTMHWAHQLQHTSFISEIEGADIIVVESAVNDYYSRSAGSQKWSEAQAALEGTNVHKYTEFLVRRLRTLFPTSALVWLAGGWHGFHTGFQTNTPRLYGNAEDIHYDVLRRYDIPQISLLHALQPAWSSHMRRWMESELFIDSRHPNELGHKMLTQLLYHFLKTMMRFAQPEGMHLDRIHADASSAYFGKQWLHTYAPVPCYITAYETLLKDPVWSIDFESAPLESNVKSLITQSPKWFITHEHGNQGLVSLCPSCASMVATGLNASADAAARNAIHVYFNTTAKGLLVSVFVLKSYEYMGILNVVLRGGTTVSAYDHVLWNTTVDCLWQYRMSFGDAELHTVDVTTAWAWNSTAKGEKEPTTMYYDLELSRLPTLRNSVQKLKLLHIDISTS